MIELKGQYRLVTRSDFDGLVCAVLLKELDLIDDIKFVHPKDMQDGAVDITDRDITTNLPYVEGVGLAFDHHASEGLRNDVRDNHIIEVNTPSAARVVYNYFGGADRFPRAWDDMMVAVDKADAAQFSREEILNPTDWVMLNFLMDPRTGLGRFRNFRISNYNLMMELIEYCKNNTIDKIMQLPDVVERVELYNEQKELFEAQVRACSEVHDELIILNLKDQDVIHAGNRFMIYAMYPQCNLSVHHMWGFRQQNTVFAMGKSILDRSSQVHVGELMLSYGGGGHANAGTCQVANEDAERVKQELIQKVLEADPERRRCIA